MLRKAARKDRFKKRKRPNVHLIILLQAAHELALPEILGHGANFNLYTIHNQQQLNAPTYNLVIVKLHKNVEMKLQ